MSREVTLSVCQYCVEEIRGFEDMAARVHRFLDQAAGADIVVFPELFTIELFTTLPEWRHRPISDLVLIDQFTSDYKALFAEEAKRRGCFIAAGSHLERVAESRYENIAYLFGPDGECFPHSKTHIFPAEAGWSTAEGDRMDAITLPFAKVGFNVCYENEIPECAASLAEQGAEIILAPSATFNEQGFWRVRHCAQARCVENQVYLVHSCLGGELGAPLPSNFARSSILGPCDLAWKNAAGIIAEAPTGIATTVTATVDIDLLYENRLSGAATTFHDRRRQARLYRNWPSHVRP
ncbi:carbon-nitrogen hydrolase family protein [Brucella anthropi]|uniref:carbon-nitrogen hydrolase family protein n=1 Tax=Brucella anthropi TaxID=529 RepID=UPI00077509B0|nr:carbon-nitrogen hydrolase family protein [Brucella anthropi]KXO77837.1 amidohydrolase [Brucella anthropi]